MEREVLEVVPVEEGLPSEVDHADPCWDLACVADLAEILAASVVDSSRDALDREEDLGSAFPSEAFDLVEDPGTDTIY